MGLTVAPVYSDLQLNSCMQTKSAILWGQTTVYLSCRNYLYEPRCERAGFLHAKTKTQISFAITAKLIGAFVFAI